MKVTSPIAPVDWLPNTTLAELGQRAPITTSGEAEALLRVTGTLHALKWEHIEVGRSDDPATNPDQTAAAGSWDVRGKVLAEGLAYGTDPWAITDQLPDEVPAGTRILIEDPDRSLYAEVEPGPADEGSAPSSDHYSPLQWQLREVANQIAAKRRNELTAGPDYSPDLINQLNAIREEAAVTFWPPGLSVQLTGPAREAHPDLLADVIHEGIEFGQFAADRRIMRLAAMDDAELHAATVSLNQEQLTVAQQLAGRGSPEWWQDATLGDFADTLAQAEEWRHLSPSAQHVWNQINERLDEATLPRLDSAYDATGYVSLADASEVAARLEHSRLTTLASTATGSNHQSAAGSDPVDVSGLSPEAAARTREIAQQRAAHAATAQQTGRQQTTAANSPDHPQPFDPGLTPGPDPSHDPDLSDGM